MYIYITPIFLIIVFLLYISWAFQWGIKGIYDMGFNFGVFSRTYEWCIIYKGIQLGRIFKGVCNKCLHLMVGAYCIRP